MEDFSLSSPLSEETEREKEERVSPSVLADSILFDPLNTKSGMNRHRWIGQWGGRKEKLVVTRHYFDSEVVKEISAGGRHASALCLSGRVYIWGEQMKGCGELGMGDGREKVTSPILHPHLNQTGGFKCVR